MTLPAPRPIAPRFSLWLDLFRWVAAGAVCTSHVRAAVLVDYSASMPWLVRPLYLLTGFGHEAVIIFFVLSGYLVGGEVLRGFSRGDFDGWVYGSRRAARLHVVLVPALLLGAGWDLAGLHFFNAHQLYTAFDPASPMFFFSAAAQLTWSAFAGNLAFCQTLLVPPFGSNYPLWSLANEAWYYLLFPLAAALVWGRGPAGRKVACLLLLVAGLWFVRGEVLRYFSLWLAGAALYFLPRPLLRPAWLPPLALAGALALTRLHLLGPGGAFRGDLLIALTFALWLNGLEHNSLNAPGPAALHRRLAGFSFTLYVAHWPLILLLVAACDQAFGLGHLMQPGAAALGFAALMVGVVYAYAWAVAQLTEQHTTVWRNRLLRLAGRPT